jgi:hypothetical protein
MPANTGPTTIDADAGFLGILMLDTRFPRPPGDIGNPLTFSELGIPVRYAIVQGASPRRIVQQGDPALLKPFVDAGQALVRQGARMLSTSCGFLALWQAQLAREIPVPVLTSSLLACAGLLRPGILTIDAQSLGRSTLRAAGVADDTPVHGVTPDCEFQRCILGNELQMDLDQARDDVVQAARQLVRAHPGITEIVLECTNMPPYRQAVMDAARRPVVDIMTMLQQAWSERGVAR